MAFNRIPFASYRIQRNCYHATIVRESDSRFNRATPFNRIVCVRIRERSILRTVCRATIRSRIRATVTTSFFYRFAVFLWGEVLMFLGGYFRFYLKWRSIEIRVICFKLRAQYNRLYYVRDVSFGKVFVNGPFTSYRLMRTIMELKDRCVVLSFGGFSVYYTG